MRIVLHGQGTGHGVAAAKLQEIDRSKKAKVGQMIEISNEGKIEEIEITNLLWAQISKQNRVYNKGKQLESRGRLLKANKRHIGIGQTHKNVSTLPYREMSILEDETRTKMTIGGHPLL